MKTLTFAAILSLLFMLATAAYGQQMDFAFGFSTISAPAYNSSSPTINYPPQSLTGGGYPAISGDFLLHKHFGIMGEIAWRASQGLYNGYQPYRPIFWDFNGLYLHNFSKRVTGEFSAGVGAESTRFYTNFYSCNYFGGCTNYATSTHFMGQFGAGLKLYVHGGLFIRPELHYYLVHNNVEYTSSHVLRYGGSLGYTFGGR